MQPAFEKAKPSQAEPLGVLGSTSNCFFTQCPTMVVGWPPTLVARAMPRIAN